MRLRHIEVFHAVYSSGSMTQAARVLNVSQPSISKALAHAELQVGFALFDRSKGRLVPTPEAVRLHEHVARLFEHLASVKRVASHLRDSAEGKIRIAATPALGIDLLPSLVAAYMQEHPDVFFEIETLHFTEITNAIRESRIDLALAFDPPTVPGFASHALAEGRMVLIAPATMHLPKDRAATLSDLAGLPFIRLNGRGPLGQLLETHFTAHQTELNVVAGAETYHLAKSLVAKGVGVAVVDQITAGSDLDEQVQVIDLDPQLNFQVSVLHLEHAPPSRVMQKFIDHLARRMPEHLQTIT